MVPVLKIWLRFEKIISVLTHRQSLNSEEILYFRDLAVELTVFVVPCIFSFLFTDRELTTWPANNCLQIIVLLQIIFCSCIIESTILCENGESVPRAGREWFDMFSWWKERWSNEKTIIELGYCKISWFATVSQISYLQLFIFDLLATDKSRYFVQLRSIIVNYYNWIPVGMTTQRLK